MATTLLNGGIVNATPSPNASHLATNVTLSIESASSTTSSSIQMSTIYVVIGVIGIIGNLGVIVVINVTPSLRSKLTNVFIVNQSCLDLLVSVLLIGTANINSVVPYSGLAGDLYCKFWQTKLFLWAFMLSSTYNLLSLSIERYVEVCHPIWHKTYSSRQKVYVALGVIWVAGVAYQSAAFVPTSYVRDRMCRLYARWPGTAARRFYGITVVTLRYFIPLIVLTLTYGRIAWKLHQKVKQKQLASKMAAGNDRVQDSWHIGRRNTIRTLFIMAACYILCWSINQIYYFMFNVGYAADFTSDLYHSSVALVFLSAIINPVIYIVSYRQFKMATIVVFRCRTSRVGALESSVVSNSTRQQSMTS